MAGVESQVTHGGDPLGHHDGPDPLAPDVPGGGSVALIVGHRAAAGDDEDAVLHLPGHLGTAGAGGFGLQGRLPGVLVPNHNVRRKPVPAIAKVDRIPLFFCSAVINGLDGGVGKGIAHEGGDTCGDAHGGQVGTAPQGALSQLRHRVRQHHLCEGGAVCEGPLINGFQASGKLYGCQGRAARKSVKTDGLHIRMQFRTGKSCAILKPAAGHIGETGRDGDLCQRGTVFECVIAHLGKRIGKLHTAQKNAAGKGANADPPESRREIDL